MRLGRSCYTTRPPLRGEGTIHSFAESPIFVSDIVRRQHLITPDNPLRPIPIELPDAPVFAVLGCIGEHNAGDEALFLSSVQQLRARWLDARFVAFSNSVEHTRSTYGVEAVSALSLLSLKTIIPAVRQGVIRDAIATIARCDCLVICGGELIRTDFGMRATMSIFDRILIARLLGKPRIFLGVGAGGLDDPRQLRLMRFAAAGAPILARETESAQRLQNAGIGLPEPTCDMALLLEPAQPGIELPAGPWCAISLRDPATTKSCRNISIGRDELVRRFATAADHVVEALGMTPVFLPFGLEPDDDRHIHREVRNCMRHGARAVLHESELPVDTLLGAVGRASLVLGMRLHACIFAMNQMVPVVGIAYDDKVRKQFEYFDIAEHCIAIDGPDRLCTMLSDATARAAAIRSVISSRLAELRAHAADRLDTALGRSAQATPARTAPQA